MGLVFDHFDLVLRAFALTLGLFAVSAVGSVLIGTMMAAMRVGPVSVLARFAGGYITIVRNTPLLIVFIFVAIGMPRLGVTFKSVEQAGINAFFFRGCVALTFYTAPFVAEAIRSGINAVSLGQAEAARSIGMTFGTTMTQVVLPQAVRAAVPPLASVLIALLKNSSVGAAFGLAEAAFRMKYFSNRTAQDEGVFLIFALGYVLLVEVISFGSSRLERRWRVER
jgi:glutamate transport system permease protein